MVATILVRRMDAASYTPPVVDNERTMSIESEDELEGLRRAGRVVAVVLRELRRRVQPGVSTGELDGFYADACVSVPVGSAAPRVRRLVGAADAALARGLAAAVAGAPVHAIGTAVADEAAARRVTVLEDLGGHGIGRTIHEPPSVPNTPDPADPTRLDEGLVITVEPILAAGGRALRQEDDGWTISTADGSWAAHAEHTIVVMAGRPLIVTS
jgi:methionyl aminopeptidase